MIIIAILFTVWITAINGIRQAELILHSSVFELSLNEKLEHIARYVKQQQFIQSKALSERINLTYPNNTADLDCVCQFVSCTLHQLKNNFTTQSLAERAQISLVQFMLMSQVYNNDHSQPISTEQLRHVTTFKNVLSELLQEHYCHKNSTGYEQYYHQLMAILSKQNHIISQLFVQKMWMYSFETADLLRRLKPNNNFDDVIEKTYVEAIKWFLHETKQFNYDKNMVSNYLRQISCESMEYCQKIVREGKLDVVDQLVWIMCQ
eukprot:83261_1